MNAMGKVTSKVAAIETLSCDAGWRHYHFVKLTTDDGIIGWSEFDEGFGAPGVATAIQKLGERVVGMQVGAHERIYAALYAATRPAAGGVVALAMGAIENALLDAKAKALGVPCYELLGGKVRERMKVYSWVGGDRPGDVVENIERLMEGGFDTFKLNGCEELAMLDSNRAVDAAVSLAASVRAALGNRVDFGLDFHGRVALPMAKPLLNELAPLRPLFVEEPVLAEQAEHYPALAAFTAIPLAAGERMYSRFEFKRVLQGGGIAILQPDLSHAGGITECHKIAAMAEAHDVALAPHCPLGPVALAACLQLDFVAWNAVLQEQSMGIHYNRGGELLDYVINKDDFRIEAGHMRALPKPGLGVEIDEERVRHASRHAPDWHNPQWRHADGSVAEW